MKKQAWHYGRSKHVA